MSRDMVQTMPERDPRRWLAATDVGRDDPPIVVLRRVVAVVEAHAPPAVAARFVAAVRRYEAGAATGLTLDAALGLAAKQSACGWWTTEARQLRDVAIRAVRLTRFGDLSTVAAARAIVMLASRRPDLFRGCPVPRSYRQVMRILARAPR
jgi:hypothetical protein